MRTGSTVGLALLVLCAGGPATAAEGLYDASYGNEGRLIHSDFGALSATVRSVVLSDGYVVLAGTLRSTGQLVVTRLRPDGTRDINFGTTGLGYTVLPLVAGGEFVRGIAVRSNGRIVVDLVVWPKVFDVDRLGPGEGTSRTECWTLDPATGTTAVDVLTDLPIEFPRIDERLTGTAHRLGYAVQVGSPGSIHMPLHRIDVERGSVETLDLGPSWAFGEVVFVPRDGAASESEGWLVGYATDREAGRSDLVVVAADDVAAGPVARVHLPVRVPDGFHGNWLPDGG